MSVFFTDSNCELWYDQLEKLDVKCIEMPYIINNEEKFYDLGKTTNFKEFYNNLRQGEKSLTSALNAENYKDIFEPIFKNGDDILYVSFSHAMSGTFNQLRDAINQLKEKYPNRKFTMFNTNAISVPASLQVVEAAKLKLNGATDKEIIDFLKEFTNKVCCYFIVDSLMYLKRSGRLSTSAAIAGSIVNLKPVLTFDSKGSLKVFSKTIGRKAAISFLNKKILGDVVDATKYDVYIYDADCRFETKNMAKDLKLKNPQLNIKLQTIGPVIGSHCGPNVIAVAYVAKQKPNLITNIDDCVEIF